MRLLHRIFALAFLCLAFWAEMLSQPRNLTPNDVLRLEEIRDVAIAPDGSAVAYERRRSVLSALLHEPPIFGYDDGKDRSDIWIASVAGGRPTNITNGELDGTGCWMPRWSPDGRRIAMLCNKGRDNVRLWIWEKAGSRLTKLSERRIATSVMPFTWIDNQRLAVVLEAECDHASEWVPPGVLAIRDMPKRWAKKLSGREPAVSTLESGLPPDFVSTNVDARCGKHLAIFNSIGRAKAVELGISFDDLETALNLQVAPDGTRIAFLKLVARLNPDVSKPLQFLGSSLSISGYFGHDDRYQVVLSDLDGHITKVGVEDLAYAVPGSFRWSRDGHSFAFIGVYARDSQGLPFRVFVGALDGTIEQLKLPDVNPKQIVWTSGNRLLLSFSSGTSDRTNWWLASPGKIARNLTEKLKVVPANLLPDSTGLNFVGVAGGKVWLLNVDSGDWTNLTNVFDVKISDLAWPTFNWKWDDDPRHKGKDSLYSGFAYILVSASDGTVYYRLHIASGGMIPVKQSSKFEKLVGYYPQSDLAVFTANEPTKTVLTIVENGKRRYVVETNSFLRDVAAGGLRSINYQSLDGKDLRAWIILPANYEAGRHYPLVSWVYAGAEYGKDVPLAAQINANGFLNLQLLASKGYAVLLPSMPLAPVPDGDHPASNPYCGLTSGVLPAIDKAIELGIADPKRLAVMGHSFGGFTTYALVTQTNRFKAAIALAGPSDFISSYGTFTAPLRQFDSYTGWLWPQSVAEAGQNRLGSPPWRDIERYVRNSPLFYVDRVQTPLLIVQGDMDFVPIQQGEEFFTALRRQGKRARFIRYWGEGHFITSPANVRDFWAQSYAWLDEFCDISRDAKGNLIFDGYEVKSRSGAPPLKPADFASLSQKESQ